MTLPSRPPSPPSGPFKSDSYPDATPLDLTGILELRVNSTSVGLYPVAQPTISDDITAATAITPSANSPYTSSICFSEDPSTISFDILAKRRLNGLMVDRSCAWYLRSCQSPWFVTGMEGAAAAVVPCFYHRPVNCVDLPLWCSGRN